MLSLIACFERAQRLAKDLSEQAGVKSWQLGSLQLFHVPYVLHSLLEGCQNGG